MFSFCFEEVFDLSIHSFYYSKDEFAEDFPLVADRVIEKSDEQVSLIRLVDGLVEEFVRPITEDDYVSVPLDNFYIVPSDVFLSLRVSSSDSRGICYPYYKSIVLHEDCTRSTLDFVSVVTHEILHACARVFKRPHYRVGLQVGDTFEGLTEGVICYIEMMLHPHLLKSPLLSAERCRFEKLFADLPENERSEDISFFDSSTGAPVFFGYNDLAEFLHQISLEIKDALSIESVKDVLYAFFRAHFTGHLLPLARIVEKSFGRGAFRVLGDMGKDEDWGFKTFTALKEMQ